MTEPQLAELETKLAVLEGGGEIYQVIVGLIEKAGELEVEVSLLAEGFQHMAQILPTAWRRSRISNARRCAI